MEISSPPFHYNPSGQMTISQDVSSILSFHGLQVNDRIRKKYYEKKRYAIGTISNGQKRPSKFWTQANRGRSERAILEAAICVAADLREQGWKFDLHHLIPVSLGGSYNIDNIRLVPSCVNRFIGNDIYTEREIQEFCEVAAKTALGKKQGIPSWFKCCSLAEFIELASVHLNK